MAEVSFETVADWPALAIDRPTRHSPLGVGVFSTVKPTWLPTARSLGPASGGAVIAVYCRGRPRRPDPGGMTPSSPENLSNT